MNMAERGPSGQGSPNFFIQGPHKISEALREPKVNEHRYNF